MDFFWSLRSLPGVPSVILPGIPSLILPVALPENFSGIPSETPLGVPS